MQSEKYHKFAADHPAAPQKVYESSVRALVGEEKESEDYQKEPKTQEEDQKSEGESEATRGESLGEFRVPSLHDPQEAQLLIKESKV